MRKRRLHNKRSQSHPDNQSESQSREHLNPTHAVIRMEVAAYVLGVLAFIAGAIAGLLASIHSRDAAIWFTCGAVVLAVIGAACWLQDREWKRDARESPDNRPAVPTFTSPAPLPETPTASPSTPTIVTPAPTPEATPTPATPTPAVTALTPNQIFAQMMAAGTSRNRENLAKLCVRRSVDWTLMYVSANPTEDDMLVWFGTEVYSGVIKCRMPINGNEDFPFKPPGGRYRVRGTIEEVTIMSITLKDCTLDPILPETPSP